MRGGIFDEGYIIDLADFSRYVSDANRPLGEDLHSMLGGLSGRMTREELITKVINTQNLDLIRIAFEYLPLTFSRRHGDPSRPWNKFSIETRNPDGSKNLDYQGNWRDIFQNWEALAYSYPGYINSMISRFLNASTIDGYNPYRIMRKGVDWEVVDPEDPWSYIGYWGDHQIIYLQKLLEISFSHSRDELLDLLDKPYFVFANVPYVIKSFENILEDPKDTIVFNHDKESVIEDRVDVLGSDGKLVFSGDKFLRASLTEKLLITLLTKYSNFIPDGGIWLNTQRPEWNDANNALVGNGVSMVTLYYLRRYLSFLKKMLDQSDSKEFALHSPVYSFFHDIFSCLDKHKGSLANGINDELRFQIVSELGRAGDTYRESAYDAFLGAGSELVSKESLIDFINLALTFTDHSIRNNKGNNGLYQAYNLVEFSERKAAIINLYDMLEGQVSVLSAGLLSSEESLEVLDALRKSAIFREDLESYMLYPDRELPRFLEKNTIPPEFIKGSELAQVLISDGDITLLSQDINGNCHFNGTFNNVNSLKDALEDLKSGEYEALVNKEYDEFLQVFEEMFNHKAFTGRSGTFYGYEGLGSIYWHMVSKLLVAVEENIELAIGNKADKSLIDQLRNHYYEIRAGIGVHKSPAIYGAFPTDPYSHTPAHKGAQQPGMTGQVKEDILSRWAELGVKTVEGKLSFDPNFLLEAEYLEEGTTFEYFDLSGEVKSIDLGPGMLAFTYCMVPVEYNRGKDNDIRISYSNGETEMILGKELPKELSSEVFNRTGKISKITVNISQFPD
jgi:hypothetical protein